MPEQTVEESDSTYFGGRHSVDQRRFVAGGKTIYPKSRSISKSAYKNMIKFAKNMHKREQPMHSLDVTLPVASNYTSTANPDGRVDHAQICK